MKTLTKPPRYSFVLADTFSDFRYTHPHEEFCWDLLDDHLKDQLIRAFMRDNTPLSDAISDNEDLALCVENLLSGTIPFYDALDETQKELRRYYGKLMKEDFQRENYAHQFDKFTGNEDDSYDNYRAIQSELI